MIIRTNLELQRRYDELTAGDCFVGMLSLKNLRLSMFVDLLERGIKVFPSPLSQTASRSKTCQARIFRQWMPPHTLIITRRADLMEAISTYSKLGITPVVTKEDRLQCGFGIHRWDNMEAVYNHASFDPGCYPFVVQPFLQEYYDVRVIVAGDYHEAYLRKNPHNFRMNLSAGGVSTPYEIDSAQLALCRAIMDRGKFPYAHIDLMIVAGSRSYLSEIALNGGIKGAQINHDKLDAIKKDILNNAAMQ